MRDCPRKVASVRGRKRKPTALLTASADIYTVETTRGFEPIAPSETVEPPTFLVGVALDTWRRLAPMLSAMRVLTRADEMELAMLCENWAMYCDNQAEIARVGRAVYSVLRYDDGGELVGVSVSAMVANSVRLRDAVNRGLTEFGLTPAARARLIVGKLNAPNTKASLFARAKK